MRQYIVLAVVLLLVLLFLWERNLQAPIHVSDSVYDLFLSTLLSHRVREVSVEHLDESRYHILDARSYREFEVSHIPGATWVGYEEFSLDRLAGIDNQTPLAVYCSVGYRSEQIAEQLQRQGYANVVNVYGGIFEWVNTKHPVVNDDGGETDEIHGYSKFWGFWLGRGTSIYD